MQISTTTYCIEVKAMDSAVASGQNRGDGGKSLGCRTLEQLKEGCSSQVRGYLGPFTY